MVKDVMPIIKDAVKLYNDLIERFVRFISFSHNTYYSYSCFKMEDFSVCYCCCCCCCRTKLKSKVLTNGMLIWMKLVYILICNY